MLIPVTQRLPDGSNTQKTYINSDNIARILPWKGGAMVTTTDGSQTETLETPDQITAKVKE